MALPCRPTPRRCLGLSASGAADGEAWPWIFGRPQEVAQGGSSRVVAAVARPGGARLFSRPVLFVEVGAEVGDVSSITQDRPPLRLQGVLVAQGLDLRFDLAMIVHILTDLHVLGAIIPLGPRAAVLPVPLDPSYEATDDGQVGLPSPVLEAGLGAWLWLWVWLLMQKLQALVDVGVLLLLMRMLQGLVSVRVLLGTPQRT